MIKESICRKCGFPFTYKSITKRFYCSECKKRWYARTDFEIENGLHLDERLAVHKNPQDRRVKGLLLMAGMMLWGKWNNQSAVKYFQKQHIVPRHFIKGI